MECSKCSKCGRVIQGFGFTGKCKRCLVIGRIPWNKGKQLKEIENNFCSKCGRRIGVYGGVSKCQSCSKKGKIPWNKGKNKIRKMSEGQKKYKYDGFFIENYYGKRDFCYRFLGSKCKHCETRGKKYIIHHKYPSEKKFEIIAECYKKLEIELVKELRKCYLLCVSCHSKLHARAYNYLVVIGKYQEYIDWFLKEFKVRVFEDYISGVVKHHKDLNVRNKNRENLLFLRRGDHQTLHLKSYCYLEKIGEIERYLEWFKNKGSKNGMGQV